MSEPEQIARLKEVSAQYGQAEVARRMQKSSAQISQIKNGRYPSPTDSFFRQMDSIFAPGNVTCPVLGELARAECHAHRTRPFAATNPTRVQLWNACRTCINNPETEASNEND